MSLSPLHVTSTPNVEPPVESPVDSDALADRIEHTEPNLLNTVWWDLLIVAAPDQEDIIYWRLEQFGFRGMTSENLTIQLYIHAYLLISEASILDLAALALQLKQDALVAGFDPPKVSWEQMESEDWAVSWKAHWQPQPVGDYLLICPAWLDPPADMGKRHVLRMDPGMAFGTGVHPTTQLCLEALEMRLDTWGEERVPTTIADIGCGSGILSIAAALLGAQKAYAVDTDPLAVAASTYNRDLNHLEAKIEIILGGLDKISTKVDGLVCNILTDVILDLIPEFKLMVKEDGWLILSGILIEQAPLVASALENHEWVVSALWKRGEWCCLNVRQAH